MSLSGKTAVVTGGARGIGRGIVLALARQGAKVAFTYVSQSSLPHAESLVQEIRALTSGATAYAIQADSTSSSSPAITMSSTLSHFEIPHIDILINNAGVGSSGSRVEDITSAEFDFIMSINVRAVITTTQAYLKSAVPTGGRIVNLSSVSARGGYATQSVYSASKAAVESLTRVWATELGPKYGGMTVNCVNPGPVDTEMYRAAGETHLKRMEEENKKTPAGGRVGTENDVAEIVAFLCEERARWVTGDVVCANGGMMYI